MRVASQPQRRPHPCLEAIAGEGVSGGVALVLQHPGVPFGHKVIRIDELPMMKCWLDSVVNTGRCIFSQIKILHISPPCR